MSDKKATVPTRWIEFDAQGNQAGVGIDRVPGTYEAPAGYDPAADFARLVDGKVVLEPNWTAEQYEAHEETKRLERIAKAAKEAA